MAFQQHLKVLSTQIRLFSLRGSFIFIVSCNFHVTVTSFSVFYFYYYCLLESVKNNLCTIHIKNIIVVTFLSNL